MLNRDRLFLRVLLTVTSVFTFINLLTMPLFPTLIPLSSFSAVRIMFVAFVEKQYYLIPVSVLICALPFLATISIRRQRIVLPLLSLMYLIYDFIIVFSLLIDGLNDYGQWRTYVVQTLIAVALILSLCIYCWSILQTKLNRRNI